MVYDPQNYSCHMDPRLSQHAGRKSKISWKDFRETQRLENQVSILIRRKSEVLVLLRSIMLYQGLWNGGCRSIHDLENTWWSISRHGLRMLETIRLFDRSKYRSFLCAMWVEDSPFQQCILAENSQRKQAARDIQQFHRSQAGSRCLFNNTTIITGARQPLGARV